MYTVDGIPIEDMDFFIADYGFSDDDYDIIKGMAIGETLGFDSGLSTTIIKRES